MSCDRFRLPVAVCLILLQEDEILLLRRFQTGFMDGFYCPIAGCIDGGESIREAMIREAKEEAGITIKPDDLQFGTVIHRSEDNEDAWESVSFYFVAKRFEGTPTNCEPHKCDAMGFFPLSNLPENITPYVRAGIKAALKGPPFLEWGFS